jgi:hypothetical protein
MPCGLYLCRFEIQRRAKAEVIMASETELFYLVLLALLTLIIHLILAKKHRREDRHSRA